jgi:hypothetical protein
MCEFNDATIVRNIEWEETTSSYSLIKDRHSSFML